ncbi:MAG: hypothetical protein ACI4RO_05725 [Candidatus Scatosoma sp.]
MKKHIKKAAAVLMCLLLVTATACGRTQPNEDLLPDSSGSENATEENSGGGNGSSEENSGGENGSSEENSGGGNVIVLPPESFE